MDVKLDGLPGDILAKIYLLLDNECTATGSSRKNFYNTCKALRGDSVTSLINSLTLDLHEGDSFERLATFPRLARLLHLKLLVPNASPSVLGLVLSSAPACLARTVTTLSIEGSFPAVDALVSAQALCARFPLLSSLKLPNDRNIQIFLEQLARQPGMLQHLGGQLHTLEIDGPRLQDLNNPCVSLLNSVVRFRGLRNLVLKAHISIDPPDMHGELATLSELSLLERLELGFEASLPASGLQELLQSLQHLKELQLETLPFHLPSLASSSVELFIVGTMMIGDYPDLLRIRRLDLMPRCKVLRVLGLLVPCNTRVLPVQVCHVASANSDADAACVDWEQCTMEMKDEGGLSETLAAVHLSYVRLLEPSVLPMRAMKRIIFNRLEFSAQDLVLPLATSKTDEIIFLHCTLATTTLLEVVRSFPNVRRLHINFLGKATEKSLLLLAACMLQRVEPLSVVLEGQSSNNDRETLSLMRDMDAVHTALHGEGTPPRIQLVLGSNTSTSSLF